MIVITPVGISLLLNCDSVTQNELNRLESIRANAELDEGQQIKYNKIRRKLVDKIKGYKKGGNDFYKYSAEIASLEKIIFDAKGQKVVIQLITTDSALSLLSAELIVFWFSKYHNNDEVEIYFDKGADFIKDLRVDKADEFENNGANNLLNWLYRFLKGKNKSDVQLNTTGGYKALTPWLTLFAQLEGIKSTYLYEETKERSSELISVENLPVNFDNHLVESFAPFLNDSKLKNKDYWTGFIGEKGLEDLESFKLIKKEGEQFRMTILGVLMVKYFEKKSHLNFSIIGKYIELLLEIYLLKNKHDNIISNNVSYEIERGVHFDNRAGNGDFDILLKNENEREIIICEVKSFSNIRRKTEDENVKGVIAQAEKLIRAAREEYRDLRIKKFVLFVYGAEFLTQKDHCIKDYLLDIQSKINELNVNFTCLLFTLPVPKGQENLNINYQELIDKGITPENIRELMF